METTLKIEAISRQDAERLVNDELRIPQNPEWLARFNEGFQDEFSVDPGRFTARENRTYYLISNQGRKEALTSTRFTNPVMVNVSSIGRLFQKTKLDQSVCEGWQYLDVLIQNVLRPSGAKRVLSSLVTKGSVRCFRDLRRICEQSKKGYRVEILEDHHPYPVAVVTVDTP
jgi:hypothetical protein